MPEFHRGCPPRRPTRTHVMRWRTQYKITKVPLLQRKPSYCLPKSSLLLLEELNNAGILAVSVITFYDATKAFAVLR